MKRGDLAKLYHGTARLVERVKDADSDGLEVWLVEYEREPGLLQLRGITGPKIVCCF